MQQPRELMVLTYSSPLFPLSLPSPSTSLLSDRSQKHLVPPGNCATPPTTLLDMPGSLDYNQPHAILESSLIRNSTYTKPGLLSSNVSAYSSDEDAMIGCLPARRTTDSRPRLHLPSVGPLSTDPDPCTAPPPPPRTPNKLVKRSTSHSFSHTGHVSSTLGKRDSTRRPYTSHQRDQLQDSSVDSAAYTFAPRALHPSGRLDKYSFVSATPNTPRTAPDLAPFSKTPFLRRPSPDGRYLSLASGGVVSGAYTDTDETLHHLALGELSPNKSTPSFSFSSPLQAAPTLLSSNERGPRRSFSLTRLLTGKPFGFRQGSASSKHPSRLSRRTSRRIFSAPERPASMEEEGERPAKKRGLLSRNTDSSDSPLPNPSTPRSRPTTADSRAYTTESRPSRLSATPSELTSSQVGSDTGTGVFSSADEDDLDFQSDTVYDSMRTGMTKNSSTFRSPGLETLFDKPDDHVTNAESPRLPHPGSSPPTVLSRGRRGASEEDESVSTPARTVIGPRRDSHAPGSPRTVERSSPPSEIQPSLSLGAMKFPRDSNQDEFNWSDGEDWDRLHDSPTPHHATKTLAWLDKSTPRMTRHHSPVAFDSTPREFEAKINPFDWSEQPAVSTNDSPPRPKTEHGKKATESRASRPSGRGPSGFHARSTSVPVVPDVKTKVTNKFGTWGIGSKGVSEDWDDDFAFELPSMDGSDTSEEASRPNTATTMHVPLGIREAQINVVANISLVREWGLLIEELKELRARAVTLGVAVHENMSTFEEVDAMIELADLDHEEGPSDGDASQQQQSPFTSSPRFSFEDIDENAPAGTGSPSPLRVLSRPEEGDVFQSPPAVTTPQRATAAHSQAGQTSGTRPRKNSEAVALSVIEELHRRRGAADPKINRGPKMEFDTATLKNIVPYVNGLMRQFKEILRNAEGLATTPRHKNRRSEDPAFSQAFIEPGSPASPSARKGRRAQKDEPEVTELGKSLQGTLQLT